MSGGWGKLGSFWREKKTLRSWRINFERESDQTKKIRTKSHFGDQLIVYEIYFLVSEINLIVFYFSLHCSLISLAINI